MPEQKPEVRNKNFAEVAFGYTPEMAMEEARRCLQCKNKPCIAGCPVNVRIPEFIQQVAEGKFEEAYDILVSTNACRRSAAGSARRKPSAKSFACAPKKANRSVSAGSSASSPTGTWPTAKFKNDRAPENHRKVAIIGSGPAGLTCAGDLAKLGYEVTIFEAFHVPGGVLMYGIPEFRLPKILVQQEINNLRELGRQDRDQHGHRPGPDPR